MIQILEEGLRVGRSVWGPIAVTTLLLAGVAPILQAMLGSEQDLLESIRAIAHHAQPPGPRATPASDLLGQIGSFVLRPVEAIAVPWLALRAIVHGRAIPPLASIRWGFQRWGRSIWVSICLALAFAALAVVGGLIAAIVWAATDAAIAIGVGGVAAAAAIVVFSRWILAAHALVLENERGFDALRRSWRLTDGRWGQLLAIEGAVVVVTIGIQLGLALVIGGTGSGSELVRAVASAAVAAAIAPFTAGISAVLYVDLLERHDPGGPARYDRMLVRGETP